MRINNYLDGTSEFRKSRKRYDDARHAREFTFTCYRRHAFFSRNRTRQWFIDALAAARTKHRFDLWAYVIMPEHVHLLVCPRDPGLNMGVIVGEIKERVARKAILFLAQHAPHWLSRITVREGKRTRRRFWQAGGGYDRNAYEIRTVHYMIDYIHANPLRRGLVGRAEDWHWSSAAWYAGRSPVPIAMDRTIPMLDDTVS